MSFWNNEKIEQVKALAAEKRSAAEIGAAVGCSRNAIIGKMRRLGIESDVEICGRKRKILSPERRARSKRPKTPNYAAPNKPATPEDRQIFQEEFQESLRRQEAATRTVGNVKMDELQPHHCRWPQGTPGTPDFSFCGEQRTSGLPYCALHSRIAYRRPNPIGVYPDV